MTENRVFADGSGVPCTYRYALYLPEGYSKEKRYPIVFFLHGAGERGDDVELVKVHGPFKRIAMGETFDFICVAPQCPADSFWSYEVQTLNLFVSRICEELNADADRVYLTGLSMGGYGTWALALAHPEKFAAILPVCGVGMPWAAGALKNVPVWAFHGCDDPVVPVTGSIDMVNAVNQAGGEAKLTVYNGVGHDSWSKTYRNQEVYGWMLAQRRKPSQA